MRWTELDREFSQLEDQMLDARLDVTKVESKLTFRIAGGLRKPVDRFETLCAIAGAKLVGTNKYVDAEIFEESDPIQRWYRLLFLKFGKISNPGYVTLLDAHGQNAGIMTLHSVKHPASESARLCLNVNARSNKDELFADSESSGKKCSSYFSKKNILGACLVVVIPILTYILKGVDYLASATQVLQYFNLGQQSSAEREPHKTFEFSGGQSNNNVIQLTDSPNYGHQSIELKIDPGISAQIEELSKQVEAASRSNFGANDTGLRLPGFSLHAFVRLWDKATTNEAYIWDMGESEKVNRFSVYLDRANSLCCRYIDMDSGVHLLKARVGTSTFSLGSFFYLNCDLAKVGNGAIMTLRIDGRTFDRHEIFATPVNETFSLDRAILGADLAHRNGGVFDLSKIITFAETLRSEDLSIINEGLHEFRGDKVVSFLGNQWMGGAGQ